VDTGSHRIIFTAKSCRKKSNSHISVINIVIISAGLQHYTVYHMVSVEFSLLYVYVYVASLSLKPFGLLIN